MSTDVEEVIRRVLIDLKQKRKNLDWMTLFNGFLAAEKLLTCCNRFELKSFTRKTDFELQ